MSKKKITDDGSADLLTLLKQPPVPQSPSIKTLTEILEGGGSLGDFPFSLDGLLSTARFILAIKDLSERIREVSIPEPIVAPEIPSLRIPKELIRNLNRYLNDLKKNGKPFNSAKVLALLPYWPYVLQVFDMMLKRASSNAKGWNKRRWANTLRNLRAKDCPLGERTRNLAINQYRMALAYADEFKDFPRVIRSWKKRLGLPKNPRSGWKTIVRRLVEYLSPFYSVVVVRGNAKPYLYCREAKSSGSRPAVSKEAYQVAANILHLAYPEFWPQPSPTRVKHFYHAD